GRARLAAGEAQHGGAGEHLVADGEVQVDGRGLDGEELGAGLRLLAGQVGSRHVPHPVTRPDLVPAVRRWSLGMAGPVGSAVRSGHDATTVTKVKIGTRRRVALASVIKCRP